MRLYIEENARYDEVGENVDNSDSHQDVWVIKRDLLGDLHHPEDNNQVRAVQASVGAGYGRGSSYICGLIAILKDLSSDNSERVVYRAVYLERREEG